MSMFESRTLFQTGHLLRMSNTSCYSVMSASVSCAGNSRRPSECPTAVSLESLYVYQLFVFVPFASNSRITITNLRKLVVNSRFLNEHFAILNLLHLCRDTLEEFEINPSFHGMLTLISEVSWLICFDTVALPTQVQFEEFIDLSQIVSLKRFPLTLTDAKEANYVPWLCRIFSSASSTQQLEEICLKVICSGRSSDDTWWHGAFDALLQGQFKSLGRLKIFLNVALMGGWSAYGRDLNSHERLRSQRGVSVDVMCKYNLFFVIRKLLTIVFKFQCAVILIWFGLSKVCVGLLMTGVCERLSTLSRWRFPTVLSGDNFE